MLLHAEQRRPAAKPALHPTPRSLMHLDSEERFPPGEAPTARAVDGSAATPIHPALLFAPRTDAVPVVVKKRRLLQAPDGTVPLRDTPADDAERRPRVFMLAKDPAASSADAGAGHPAPGNAEAAPSPSRRRRRPALHQPSAVVFIDPPATPAAAAPAKPGAPGLPDLPAVDEYRALQASLQGLRALVDDARRAHGFAISPGRRRAG